MESRNTTLTTCGECASISPQDRKAVNTLEELLGQVEEKTSICFPLLDLIPEIIADENMERSFKRVIRTCTTQILTTAYGGGGILL